MSPEHFQRFDPTRRLEHTHPALARRLAPALEGPLPALATEIVSIVTHDILRGGDDHSRALDPVRTVIDRADSASGPAS